jgi:Protein of unknown function (DUF1573)
MIRSLILAGCCFAVLATSAEAQQWATSMFPVKTHEFGSVAKGAKAEYHFEFTNLYKEDIHIASVRASCGCTTPSITKDLVKTWEKSSIVAKFNTGTYLGQRGATVTVVIDKPFYAEVQLQVSGFIRSDVVFDPGLVNLGQLEQGSGGEAKVKVHYAGRNNWSILDVQSANPNFEVELSDPTRTTGQVVYHMTVRLKPTAPVGSFTDQLTLVTDDLQNKSIPISVEGRVRSSLDISPASLMVNALEPGMTFTKPIIVQSKQKFRVTKVTSSLPGFEFKVPENSDAKTLHVIPMTFTAGGTPGDYTAKIKIETDLGFSAECNATGTIKPVNVVKPTSSNEEASKVSTDGFKLPSQTTAKLPR